MGIIYIITVAFREVGDLEILLLGISNSVIVGNEQGAITNVSGTE